MNRPIVSLSLLLISTLPACAGDDAGPNDDRYVEILAGADFGAQMTVLEENDSWSGAAGDATTDVAMTTDNVLLIGSNTKMLTTAVVLQLVDEGALGLDDAAASWVPQLRGDITIRMLLQHRSGIGEYFDNPDCAPDESWTPQELVDFGLAVSNLGPTDEVFYANTNFIALGLVVEAIEGRSFEAVLDQRIFEPLGMESAGLLMTGEAMPPHIAYGASGSLGVVTRYDASVGWAAGSAYMTSADLARFLSAMLGGELYGGELLGEQLAPGDWAGYDMPGLVETSYGLGVMIFEVQGGEYDGHMGGLDGFTSVALRNMGSGRTAVVLTNQDDPVQPVDLAFQAFGVDLGL